MKRLLAMVVLCLCVVAGLAACGGGGGTDSSSSSSSTASGGSSVTELTLWVGGQVDAATKALVTRFNEKNHDIQVKPVTQPAANYIQEVHVANVAHRAGDLVAMFPGYMTQENIPYLEDVSEDIPKEDQERIYQLQYSAAGYNLENGLFEVPYEGAYYIGIYNEALFSKAGIKALPKNWNELYSDCGKLKKIGVTPISYGSDLFSAGAAGTFYVGFDLANLLGGAIEPNQVPELLSGKIPWTSPSMVSQLEKWAKLYEIGCTNSNPLSNSHVLEEYSKEESAMFIAGDWFATAETFKPSLFAHTGVIVPPFHEGEQQNLVAGSGAGYAATSYGSHVPEAVKFLQFVASPEGGELVANASIAPAMSGTSTAKANRQHKQLAEWRESGEYLDYPTIDNLTWPTVLAVLQSELPQVFVGKESPEAALQAVQQATEELPAEQRELSAAPEAEGEEGK
jgi:raffinose/stachyose/melibiose transport system substrate-binding protein